MLKRVVLPTTSSLILAAGFVFGSACSSGDDDTTSFSTFTTFGSGANTSNDDMDDMDDEMETGDAMGDGDGDPTGDGDGDPSGDGDEDPTGDGDGDPTGDGDGDTTGDGDGDPTGDGDGDPGPSCGNGVLDPGETCDGNDFGGVTCVDLGYDQGTLSCNSCAVDTSTCSNSAQPGLGQLYSHCLDANGCPGLDGCATVSMEGEDVPFDGFCTNLCESDAECFANTGGSAVPVCNDEANSFCELDCSDGKTCPGGMECISLVGGKELCY